MMKNENKINFANNTKTENIDFGTQFIIVWVSGVW